MADLARADELVHAMDQDAAFRGEVEAAPTAAAKRQVLDARGYQDITLEDMKAYVESKGGKLVVGSSGRELSEQELAAAAGGLSDQDTAIIGAVGGATLIAVSTAAAL